MKNGKQQQQQLGTQPNFRLINKDSKTFNKKEKKKNQFL